MLGDCKFKTASGAEFRLAYTMAAFLELDRDGLSLEKLGDDVGITQSFRILKAGLSKYHGDMDDMEIAKDFLPSEMIQAIQMGIEAAMPASKEDGGDIDAGKGQAG